MNEFITIDFETAVYAPNSAVSVGLVKYRDWQPVDTYYSLIRPPRLYIRPDFTDIHGLTVDDVKDAPSFACIWESEVREFIGGTILAAHNASFDMRVLRAVLEHYEVQIPNISYFCSCNLARRVWPSFHSHSLGNLAKRFGISYNAHNALDDAMTCGKLVEIAAIKTESGKNLEELFEAAGVELKSL